MLWSSAFVLLTLLINAPLIGPVMRWTGLSAVTAEKMRGRRAALAALRQFTRSVVEELKHDKGEFLQGERSARSAQLRVASSLGPALRWLYPD